MVVAQELDLERIALAALAEDVGRGDVTTEATVAEDATCTATLLLKEPGVVCGLPAVEAVLPVSRPERRRRVIRADGDYFEQPPSSRASPAARERFSPESAPRSTSSAACPESRR
jgi:nicotinate-nucleotide pyrophosphorylase